MSDPVPIVNPLVVASGWRSSEFWSGLIAKVLSLAAVFGAIGVRDESGYATAAGCLVSAVFSIASIWSASHYTAKRTELKVEAVEAVANLPLAKLEVLVAAAAKAPPGQEGCP